MSELVPVTLEFDGNTVYYEALNTLHNLELEPTEMVDILEGFNKNTNLVFVIIRDYVEEYIRYLIYKDGAIFVDNLIPQDDAIRLFQSPLDTAAYVIASIIFILETR